MSRRVPRKDPLEELVRLGVLRPGDLTQHMLRCDDSAILRLFEDRETTEVGIGKEYVSPRLSEPLSFRRKDGSHRGARHRVSHPHDVNARYALANIAVDTFQVAKNCFFPIEPVAAEERTPALGWVPICQGPIEGPYGSVHVSAQCLMGRIHVAQGW